MRLEVTLLWYKPLWFALLNANHNKPDLHNKSSDVYQNKVPSGHLQPRCHSKARSLSRHNFWEMHREQKSPIWPYFKLNSPCSCWRIYLLLIQIAVRDRIVHTRSCYASDEILSSRRMPHTVMTVGYHLWWLIKRKNAEGATTWTYDWTLKGNSQGYRPGRHNRYN